MSSLDVCEGCTKELLCDGYRAQVLLQQLSQQSPPLHRQLRQQSSLGRCQLAPMGAGCRAGAPCQRSSRREHDDTREALSARTSCKQQATSHGDPTEGSAGMPCGRSVFCQLARKGRQSAAGECLNREHNSLLSGATDLWDSEHSQPSSARYSVTCWWEQHPKVHLCPGHKRWAYSFLKVEARKYKQCNADSRKQSAHQCT